MKKESQNSLTNILSGLIIVVTLGTVIATNAPKTKIVHFKNIHGKDATFYGASLSNLKDFVEVKDAEGNVEETFSDEGDSNYVYTGNGTEYRITPNRYAVMSNYDVEQRDFAEGDSLSDFLVGKKLEFTKYFDNVKRGFE